MAYPGHGGSRYHPTRDEFSVAIIGALRIECDAIQAIFDQNYNLPVENRHYTIAPGDPNSYTTGRIGTHNIVLAHMPSMGYSSSASVVSHLARSFVNIKLCLVVGVCGGAPQTIEGDDIFLGDIVISTGVIQTDLGRQYPDRLERKTSYQDTLPRAGPQIRAFLEKLQTTTSFSNLQASTLSYLAGSRYPGAEFDRLYRADYRHKHQAPGVCLICDGCLKNEDRVCDVALESSCTELGCEESQLVARYRKEYGRVSPNIHFGLFSSGNNVVKSGYHRDELTRKEKVIAFEMEGAGVWEFLPTIIVKSVCDYADSHKRKDFQTYAATTAAACTKAVLDQWAHTDGRQMVHHTDSQPVFFNATNYGSFDLVTQRGRDYSQLSAQKTSQSLSLQDLKDQCLESLDFRARNSRKHSIKLAHPDTCDWLFSTPQFTQWIQQVDPQVHNGVFWIKGKPGSGKSTLMKHMLEYIETGCHQDTSLVVLSHFFNARGSAMEKSSLGFLRSLSYQLLSQISSPIMEKSFLCVFTEMRRHSERGYHEVEWDQDTLKSLIHKAIKSHKGEKLIILADALDECSEDEVRDVASFLEDLSLSNSRSGRLLICLSSRHYPTIGMKRLLELVVENTPAHDDDITTYVHDKLRVTEDDQIKRDIIEKSSGIFMWIILVIQLLNRSFDEGQVAGMRKKLDEIPSGLDELFWMILEKDNEYKPKTILLFQLLLFTKRHLGMTAEEIYSAVTISETPEQTLPPRSVIIRFITTVSRGLVEIIPLEDNWNTASEKCQFVHETIRDFLIRNKRLQTLDQKLIPNVTAASHDAIFLCCSLYLKSTVFPDRTIDSEFKASERLKAHPFLKYATENLFYHLNQAYIDTQQYAQRIKLLIEDPVLFKAIQVTYDTMLSNNIPSQTLGEDTNILYWALLTHYDDLAIFIISNPRIQVDVNAQGGYYGNALQLAVTCSKESIVKLLLHAGASINAQGGYYGSVLQAAAPNAEDSTLKLLLEAGADINAQGGHYGNALQAAAFNAEDSAIKLLLEAGADINAQGGHYGNALQAAAFHAKDSTIKLLLEAGADINAKGGYYGNVLQAAAASNYVRESTVEILLNAGADINAQGGYFGNALQASVCKKGGESLVVIKLLLHAGANVNAQGGRYGHSLQAAAYEGEYSAVELLIKAGADVNARGGEYSNALLAAALRGQESIVKLLIRAGADVNARAEGHGSILHDAVWTGRIFNIELLLNAGADVNAQGGRYGTALHAAIQPGRFDVFQYLVNAGADLNSYGKVTYDPWEIDSDDSSDNTEREMTALEAAHRRNWFQDDNGRWLEAVLVEEAVVEEEEEEELEDLV